MARSPVSSTNPVRPAPAAERVRSTSVVTALVRSLRPRQWTKNLIVFAGVIFGPKLDDPTAVTSAIVAFFVFCLLSGVVYLINDVRDREADRLHPIKSRRPIAAGELLPAQAIMAAAIIGVVALGVAFQLSLSFGVVAALYVVVLGLYSTSLKHMVILDVLTIAFGFVLRAWAGAEAVDVVVSHWLLLLALLLALFIGFGKRRAELVALAEDASDHRRILAEYSPYLLDQMINIVAACTLLAYALYTIDDQTVAKFQTDNLLWTFPFPLYGMLRYLYLVHQREGGGDPSELLLTDRPLLACVVLCAVVVLLIVYGPLGSGLSARSAFVD
jgi:4-hydroxybenzoate polyprenyltransferase